MLKGRRGGGGGGSSESEESRGICLGHRERKGERVREREDEQVGSIGGFKQGLKERTGRRGRKGHIVQGDSGHQEESGAH